MSDHAERLESELALVVPPGPTQKFVKPSEEKMLELVDKPNRSPKSSAAPTQLPDEFQRDLVNIFKLLSDETRLRVLMYLYSEGELHVSAMCDRLNQSQPAVSHHLALLRDAGLIGCRRDGKHNFYSIRTTHFHRIVGQLFQNVADPKQNEFRFDSFVLTPQRPAGRAGEVIPSSDTGG